MRGQTTGGDSTEYEIGIEYSHVSGACTCVRALVAKLEQNMTRQLKVNEHTP